jgi:hypothetical protein
VKPDDRKPARNPRRADPRTAAQVKPGRRFPPALAIALPLLVAASLMVASIRTMSATADEVAHLPAGFTYITMRDFRLNPEHPPLLKALAAIPLVIAGAHSPAPDGASWRAAAYDPDQEWQFGHDFLYATPGNDADRLLSLGRLAMIALALGLGALLWLWARDLWGEPTAAIAVLLWAFEPNLLAHGPLVTTDTGLAVFSFGACYLLWRCCREVTIGRAVAMAAFVALAAASKYSAILLAPMLAAVLAVRVVTPAPWIVQLRRRRVAFESRGRRAGVAAALLAMAGVAAYVALWGAYGFRYNATARGTALPQAARLRELAALPPTESNWQTEVAGLVLTEAAGAKLLPEAAIDGFASMLHDAQGRQSYVLGTISSTGHWWYFPLALAIKVPLPLLIFAVIGGVALARRRFGPDAENPTVWLVFAPPLVFLAIAMTSQLNLGVRHVLPVFPFLLLLAAAGAAHLWRGRGRARRVAAALLAAWLVVGTLRLLQRDRRSRAGPRPLARRLQPRLGPGPARPTRLDEGARRAAHQPLLLRQRRPDPLRHRFRRAARQLGSVGPAAPVPTRGPRVPRDQRHEPRRRRAADASLALVLREPARARQSRGRDRFLDLHLLPARWLAPRACARRR